MKSNPFATRFVRPGALDWIASNAGFTEQLAGRFRQQLGSRGAIVGPHGSGKSTLLEHLVPRLGDVGLRSSADVDQGVTVQPQGEVVWLGLRRKQRPFSRILASRSHWRVGGLLVLDGWEQLRPGGAICSLLLTRYARMGLLVTCHQQSVGLPTLVTTAADPWVLQCLVDRLLAECSEISAVAKRQLSDPARLRQLLDEEQGSVREVLMRLYDSYENCRPRTAVGRARHARVTRIEVTPPTQPQPGRSA